RSREEQGGGKTCVVARGRLELEGTLDIRPGSGGVADDLHGTSPVRQRGGLTGPVMPGPGAFDGLIEQGDSRSTVTLIRPPSPGPASSAGTGAGGSPRRRRPSEKWPRADQKAVSRLASRNAAAGPALL